jgi:hypothetical protein
MAQMAKRSKRKTSKAARVVAAKDTVGKRIPFDRATWDAVAPLAREQMKDLAEITEEAFRDLLKKYGRSADFREALKLSARRAKKKGD